MNAGVLRGYASSSDDQGLLRAHMENSETYAAVLDMKQVAEEPPKLAEWRCGLGEDSLERVYPSEHVVTIVACECSLWLYELRLVPLLERLIQLGEEDGNRVKRDLCAIASSDYKEAQTAMRQLTTTFVDTGLAVHDRPLHAGDTYTASFDSLISLQPGDHLHQRETKVFMLHTSTYGRMLEAEQAKPTARKKRGRATAPADVERTRTVYEQDRDALVRTIREYAKLVPDFADYLKKGLPRNYDRSGG